MTTMVRIGSLYVLKCGFLCTHRTFSALYIFFDAQGPDPLDPWEVFSIPLCPALAGAGQPPGKSHAAVVKHGQRIAGDVLLVIND